MNHKHIARLTEQLGEVTEEVAFEAVCQWLSEADINLKMVEERVAEIDALHEEATNKPAHKEKPRS